MKITLLQCPFAELGGKTMMIGKLTVILVVMHVSGCKDVSVADNVKYSSLTFKRVEVTTTCFVARESNQYVFMSDRDEFVHKNYVISCEDRPTYEEFLSGKWKDSKNKTYKILDVIVAGEVLIISDVIRKTDCETGALICVYGSFVNAKLRKKYDPILLGIYSEREPIILSKVKWVEKGI